ncbi:MAG: hypothetical protein EOP07_23205, partial [Proteobacteria bacterium]
VGYKHVTQDLLSACTIALVVTLLISSFMIPSGYSIYRFLKPILEKVGIKDHVMSVESKTNSTNKSIVLFGFYREASSFLEEFIRRHSQSMIDQLLVIDYNPETLQSLKARGVPCIYGDIGHPETLRNQPLDEAAVIISTIPDNQLKGTTNLKLLHSLRKLAPKARIIVTADTLEKAREMYAKGADYVFVPRIVGAHFLVDIIERVQGDRMDAVKQGAQRFLSEWNETLP